MENIEPNVLMNTIPASLIGGMILFMGFFFLLISAIGILLLISYWKIYKKAGYPGWAAIVPIYNIIVLLQITGKPLWWIFLFLIPFVNVIISIIVTNELSKSFGQNAWFTVGLIFVPFVFYPILAFGKYSYTKPISANESENISTSNESVEKNETNSNLDANKTL